jgi:hypothetical protein
VSHNAPLTPANRVTDVPFGDALRAELRREPTAGLTFRVLDGAQYTISAINTTRLRNVGVYTFQNGERKTSRRASRFHGRNANRHDMRATRSTPRQHVTTVRQSRSETQREARQLNEPSLTHRTGTRRARRPRARSPATDKYPLTSGNAPRPSELLVMGCRDPEVVVSSVDVGARQGAGAGTRQG